MAEEEPLNNENNNAPVGGPLSQEQSKGFSGGYKAVQLPFLSCLRTNLCCKMGYNVGMIARTPLQRKENIPLHYGPRPDSWSLGVQIGGIEHLTADLINLIRPMVRVHVVHIEHGTYLRSEKRPFVAPLTTGPYSVKDSSDCPNWQQDLVFDINYGDIFHEDALILFEVLDYRPSLNVKKSARNQGLRPPKQIAWGYLRPVSVSGSINVGVRDEWLQPAAKGSSASSSRGKKRDNRKKPNSAAAGGGAGGSGSEVESDADGRQRGDRGRNKRRSRRDDEEEDDEEDDEEGGRSSQGGVDTSGDEQTDGIRRRALRGSQSKGKSTSQSTNQEQLPQRIQLYKYQLSDGWLGSLQRKMMGWPSLKIVMDPKTRSEVISYPDGIPAVYAQWRMQHRQPIKYGSLAVVLGPRSSLYVTPHAYPVGGRSSIGGGTTVLSQKDTSSDHGTPASAKNVNRHGSTNSLGTMEGAAGALALAASPPYVKLGISKSDWKHIKTAASRRARGPKEPCVLPTKLLHRLDVGSEGAMVVAFSHSGHLLAVAARSLHAPSPFTPEHVTSPHPGCTYSLRLYDTDAGALVWCESYAHHGVVYDLKWSKDDSYVVTASADGSCKVWDVLPLFPHWHAQKNVLGLGQGQGQGQANDDDDNEPTRIPRGAPPSQSSLLSYPSKVHLLHTLVASPPVFTYAVLFQEYTPPDHSSSPLYGFVPTSGGGGAGAGAGVGGSPERFSVASMLDSATRRVSHKGMLERTPPPAVISGAADGKLRVYVGGRMTGKIRIDQGGEHEEDLPPHDGRINSLAIDERTRYLFSADSVGEIYVWRLDAQNQYELLRKFKRESPAAVPSSALGQSGVLGMTGSFAGAGGMGGGGRRSGSFSAAHLVQSTPRLGFGSMQNVLSSFQSTAGGGGVGLQLSDRDNSKGEATGASGVISMMMHPDKYKTQMLALTLEPTALRMYNTSTYKVQSVCAGCSTAGGTSCPPSEVASSSRGCGSAVFCRAGLSSDGRVVVSGTTNPNDGGCSRLRFWDSQSGAMLPSALSDLLLPYAVRSLSWHPKQHVLAVAIAGPGASVVIYCGQRESAERAVARINQSNIAALYATVLGTTEGSNPMHDAPQAKPVGRESPTGRARRALDTAEDDQKKRSERKGIDKVRTTTEEKNSSDKENGK